MTARTDLLDDTAAMAKLCLLNAVIAYDGIWGWWSPVSKEAAAELVRHHRAIVSGWAEHGRVSDDCRATLAATVRYVESVYAAVFADDPRGDPA